MTIVVVFTDDRPAVTFANVVDFFFDVEDDTFNMIGDADDLTVFPRENILFVSERPNG